MVYTCSKNNRDDEVIAFEPSSGCLFANNIFLIICLIFFAKKFSKVKKDEPKGQQFLLKPNAMQYHGLEHTFFW